MEHEQMDGTWTVDGTWAGGLEVDRWMGRGQVDGT